MNAATDIDQETEEESKIHQWRSRMLNQEETGPSNGSRDTTNLPGDHAWSKMRMKSLIEEKNSLKRVDHADQFWWNIEGKEGEDQRMTRKFSIIEDLLFSNKNSRGRTGSVY